MTEESNLSAAFPPPPKQFELFTKENIDAFERDPDSLPEHVTRAMRPPDIPTAPYSIFGETWQLQDRIQTLEEAGVERLYPQDFDLVTELQKLSRSLLLNFLELVTIMSVSPEAFPAKVENLRLIMVNMHHLINSHRPHQTREQLIALMQEQLDTQRAETEAMEAATMRAEQSIQMYKALTAPLKPDGVEKEITRVVEQQINGTQDDDDDDDDAKRDLFLFSILEKDADQGAE